MRNSWWSRNKHAKWWLFFLGGLSLAFGFVSWRIPHDLWGSGLFQNLGTEAAGIVAAYLVIEHLINARERERGEQAFYDLVATLDSVATRTGKDTKTLKAVADALEAVSDGRWNFNRNEAGEPVSIVYHLQASNLVVEPKVTESVELSTDPPTENAEGGSE